MIVYVAGIVGIIITVVVGLGAFCYTYFYDDIKRFIFKQRKKKMILEGKCCDSCKWCVTTEKGYNHCHIPYRNNGLCEWAYGTEECFYIPKEQGDE